MTTSLRDYLLGPDPLRPEAQAFLVKYTAETDLIDFKRDFDLSDREWLEIVKDIVAFANTHGGYLVFGIADGTRAILGVDLPRATQISDPATVQAKVNKFIEPKLTTLSCTRMQIDGTERFLVFMHVPPSKRSTHIVVNVGSFLGNGGSAVTSLRVGEIYVRRVGSRCVVAPQDFDQLLERRMADFKQELFRRIALVSNAGVGAKIQVLEEGQPGYDAATSYRLSSAADAQPMTGVSPTATPTSDEEELGTFLAAFRKDRSHRPAPALLYRLYARRREAAIAIEYLPPLIELSIVMCVPAVYWVRKIEQEALVKLLMDPTRFSTVENWYDALSLLALRAPKRITPLANRFLSRDPFSLTKLTSLVASGRVLDLFGTQFVEAERKRSRLRGAEFAQALEIEATTLAQRLATEEFDTRDRWRLREFDAWLYGSDARPKK